MTNSVDLQGNEKGKQEKSGFLNVEIKFEKKGWCILCLLMRQNHNTMRHLDIEVFLGSAEQNLK